MKSSLMTLALLFLSSSVMAASGAVWKPLYNPIQANPAVVTPPGAVKAVAPNWFAAVSGTTATLEWTASEGADGYHVQVATDAAFKWLVTEVQYHPQTSLEISGLEAGKQYYWRVAGKNSKNEASYIKGKYAKSMFYIK